jgi:magnesium transporter
MLRVFGPDCSPAPLTADGLAIPAQAVWIDLLEPNGDEEAIAETFVGTNIPTRQELSEIEPSSRLYQRNGAVIMTMSVLHGVTGGQPASDPIGFIFTDRHLVTVRYSDPKSFVLFANHLTVDPAIAKDPRAVLVGLLDAIIDRLADEFEAAGREIEAISRQIFNRDGHNNAKRRPEVRLEAILMRIGKVQQLLAKLRETSVSGARLLGFLASLDIIVANSPEQRHVESLMADTAALNDHSNFLGDNLTFLLDASLGMISLAQNDVMKLFSIFAVVIMPPTLVAGVYGMNFIHMPELRWFYGYPFAMLLMLASAIVPYAIARRKGWL